MHSFSKPAAYTTHDALQMLQIEQRLGCLTLVAANVARAASLGHRSGNPPLSRHFLWRHKGLHMTSLTYAAALPEPCKHTLMCKTAGAPLQERQKKEGVPPRAEHTSKQTHGCVRGEKRTSSIFFLILTVGGEGSHALFASLLEVHRVPRWKRRLAYLL